MKKEKVTIEALGWSNSELPGGKNHPDYVDSSNMTCFCDNCNSYFEIKGDGSEGCNCTTLVQALPEHM